VSTSSPCGFEGCEGAAVLDLVLRLLPVEEAHSLAELVGELLLVVPNRTDEEALPSREDHVQPVHEVGTEEISAKPVPRQALEREPHPAHHDVLVQRGRAGLGHRGLVCVTRACAAAEQAEDGAGGAGDGLQVLGQGGGGTHG